MFLLLLLVILVQYVYIAVQYVARVLHFSASSMEYEVS